MRLAPSHLSIWCQGGLQKGNDANRKADTKGLTRAKLLPKDRHNKAIFVVFRLFLARANTFVPSCSRQRTLSLVSKSHTSANWGSYPAAQRRVELCTEKALG